MLRQSDRRETSRREDQTAKHKIDRKRRHHPKKYNMKADRQTDKQKADIFLTDIRMADRQEYRQKICKQ